MIYNFLFPTKPNTTKVSLFLLAVRIIFGILLMNHGIQKWSNFQELSTAFPDPIGLGSSISLGLAIFGELVCSMGFIFGFLYRHLVREIDALAGNDPDDLYYGSGLFCHSCQ